MIPGDEHHEFVVAPRERHHARADRRSLDEGDVQPALRQCRFDVGGVADLEVDFDLGMLQAEAADELRQHVGADRRAGAESKLAGELAATLEAPLEVVRAPHQIVGFGHEVAASFRQGDAAPGPLEQRSAEAVAQFGQRRADGGLGEMEFVGGRRDMLAASHREEDLELPQGDVTHRRGR